jgi:CheY-like chemotaxis protein
VTRVLVVDAEAKQALDVALEEHGPGIEVWHAEAASVALNRLGSTRVDAIVLALNQGDEIWERLAWLREHRPEIAVLVVSESDSQDELERLSRLAVIARIPRPLEPTPLLQAILDALNQCVSGTLYNLSVPSFLQLIEIERKTCTLRVDRGDRSGVMFLRRGELLDAHTDENSGEPAALAIVGWLTGEIHIEHGCPCLERRIFKPISHLLMTAMQTRDENLRDSIFDRSLGDPGFKRLQESLAPLRTELPPNPSLPNLPGKIPQSLALPFGGLAVAVVDAETGTTLACEVKDHLDVNTWAENAAAIVRQECATLKASVSNDQLEELVVSTESCCELIRPMLKRPNCFALLVFDPSETNLSMARLDVERLVAEYA